MSFSFVGDEGRWRSCPINSPESCRAQRRPEVLGHQWMRSVTLRGIGFGLAPVRHAVDDRQGQIQLRLKAATSRSGSKTVFCLSMK